MIDQVFDCYFFYIRVKTGIKLFAKELISKHFCLQTDEPTRNQRFNSKFSYNLWNAGYSMVTRIWSYYTLFHVRKSKSLVVFYCSPFRKHYLNAWNLERHHNFFVNNCFNLRADHLRWLDPVNFIYKHPYCSNLDFGKLVQVETYILKLVASIYYHVIAFFSKHINSHFLVSVKLHSNVFEPNWLYIVCFCHWKPNYCVIIFQLVKFTIESI